jgi:hypothetical protein
MVSEDIFWRLAPGRSVELMKQMLGVPDIFRRSDTPIFPIWVEELVEFPDPWILILTFTFSKTLTLRLLPKTTRA